ncbi:hypothetical protein MMC13_005226 [Lambiella insularis]|nr:hypothetical protein [Lambiella insularis]
MSPSSTATGSPVGGDALQTVKSAASGVHGMGEAVRGTMNDVIDTAFHDDKGQAKNQSIVAKGLAEMQEGELKGRSDGAHSGAVGSMSSVPGTASGLGGGNEPL